jgi:hypothetical protein
MRFGTLLCGTATAALLALLAHEARGESEGARCDDGPAVAADNPWSVWVGANAAIGVFFRPFFMQGSIGIGRAFWRRLELEAAFRFGAGSGLIDIEGTFGVGVLVHVERRVDLMLGSRVGYALFRFASPELGSPPVTTFWISALSASPVTEVRITLTPTWELRVAPIVGTGYWNGIWGFVVQPGMAGAVRF